MLMWTIITFLYENIEFPDVRDLPNTFSTLLLARIANLQWPVDDCLVALSILSELSNLFPYIKKYNKVLFFFYIFFVLFLFLFFVLFLFYFDFF